MMECDDLDLAPSLYKKRGMVLSRLYNYAEAEAWRAVLFLLYNSKCPILSIPCYQLVRSIKFVLLLACRLSSKTSLILDRSFTNRYLKAQHILKSLGVTSPLPHTLSRFPKRFS